MKDRDFFMWLHERLEHVHGEEPTVDHMHKLRCIINAMAADTATPNDGRGCNGLEELKRRLESEPSPEPVGIRCPECGTANWNYKFKSPVDPAHDRFVCQRGHRFERYDGTRYGGTVYSR